MSLIVRNRNRYIYGIKSRIRGNVYSNLFMLRSYLKLKETLIKSRGVPANSENMLFKKVFIETVSYCNNDCAFCPASRRVGLKNPGHFMPEDLYMKIMNELANISFTGSLAFHCNNEPLLDRRLPSWVRKARGLLKSNFFYLFTNGTLVSPDLVNELLDAGLNRIIINNYNDELKPIPSVKAIIDDSSHMRGEVIINYRAKSDYLGNRAGESPNARLFLKEPLQVMCTRPLAEMVVGYDGTVPLCCADGLWKVTMGDVKKSSLRDIWFSDFWTRVRKSLVKGDRNCTEICKACDALSFFAPRGMR